MYFSNFIASVRSFESGDITMTRFYENYVAMTPSHQKGSNFVTLLIPGELPIRSLLLLEYACAILLGMLHFQPSLDLKVHLLVNLLTGRPYEQDYKNHI